jgi:hypothetical protein
MSSLNITVTDAGGAVRNSVSVPGGAPSVRIIAALVDQLHLPLVSPDGTPMSYKFHHIEGNSQLSDTATLLDSGVKEGDTLRLIPEIIAG